MRVSVTNTDTLDDAVAPLVSMRPNTDGLLRMVTTPPLPRLDTMKSSPVPSGRFNRANGPPLSVAKAMNQPMDANERTQILRPVAAPSSWNCELTVEPLPSETVNDATVHTIAWGVALYSIARLTPPIRQYLPLQFPVPLSVFPPLRMRMRQLMRQISLHRAPRQGPVPTVQLMHAQPDHALGTAIAVHAGAQVRHGLQPRETQAEMAGGPHGEHMGVAPVNERGHPLVAQLRIRRGKPPRVATSLGLRHSPFRAATFVLMRLAHEATGGLVPGSASLMIHQPSAFRSSTITGDANDAPCSGVVIHMACMARSGT